MPLLNHRLRPTLLLGLALLTGVALLGAATQNQKGEAPPERAHPRMEYLNQEIDAAAVVQTLNDLDSQGWELFQIIPVWEFRNENGNATLAARSYQVFGRRPLNGPPRGGLPAR
ncbi:MAG: hypothetical protein IRY99_02030 [Isosphaeraceae bacterium]|nr:hypothetical protein [Isosphaeraceae bacterium]